jgi:hypothetical protein
MLLMMARGEKKIRIYKVLEAYQLQWSIEIKKTEETSS